MIRIERKKDHVPIADRCRVAESFLDRLLGLIPRSKLDDGEALFFPRCNSVHMWAMRFPIDLVFLSDWRVTSVHEGVRPWKLLPVIDWKARDALELPAGTVRRLQIHVGDQLCIS